MFRKSTKEIIVEFKAAVEKYNNDCLNGVNNNGFFSTPNKPAIARKVDFLTLLSSLTESLPEQTIEAVFKFYQDKNQVDGGTLKQRSRLIHYIEMALFELCGIEEKSISNKVRDRDPYEYERKVRQEAYRQRSELAKFVDRFVGKTNSTSPIALYNSL